MNWRSIFIFISLGFIHQGCTLQKRSLMRGWHIERSGQVSTTPDAKSPEHVTDIITELHQETAVAAALPHEPLIPLKALMAFSPSFEIAPGLKRPHVLRQVNAHEAKISLRNNCGSGQLTIRLAPG